MSDHTQRLHSGLPSVRIQHLRCRVPSRAVRFLAAREHHAGIVELHRRPEPEEARSRVTRRWRRRRLAAADAPDAPRVVARSPPRLSINLEPPPADRDAALPASALRQPRVVHHDAVARSPEEVRLLIRERDAREREIELEPVLVRLGVHPHPPQPFDHLDTDRADLRVHAIRPQRA